MKKSELQAGQKVVTRDGGEYVWFPVFGGCGFFHVSKNELDPEEFIDISDYDDELKETYDEEEDYDIMSIYECVDDSRNYLLSDLSKVNWTLVWERLEEVEEITAEEAMKRLEKQAGKKVKIVRD